MDNPQYWDAIEREIDAIDEQREKYLRHKVHEILPFIGQQRMVQGRLIALIQCKIKAMQGITWELHLMLKHHGIIPYDRH